MANRGMRLVVLLAVLAGVAWSARDTAPMQDLLRTLSSTAARPWIDRQLGAIIGTRPGSGDTRDATQRPLSKCVRGAEIVYTNGDCPAGSQRQAVGGTVTVLPAQPVTAPAAPAASQPTIRDLALKPGERTLREQAAEQMR